MGFLTSLRQPVEQRSSWSGPLTSNSPELARLWAAPSSSTGIGVSESTALAYSAVWAAVSLISADVASLPLILYKREPNGGKSRFTDHKLYRILHDEPNPEMSSMLFRETLQAHALTWGNAYAEIERDGQGRPLYLWPLTPDRVSPYRDDRTGRIYYRVTNGDGGDIAIPAADMIHVPGLGYDGWIGYSVISKARESIGLGLATERFGGTFFGNGAQFGGVFEHPTKMTEQAQKNFKESIAKQHQGVERAHRFIVVEEGMKYQRLGIPPNDAQFLETRKFQINEIARWFRVPPHKLADLDRSTNNNIEHQGIEYYTDTLRPWLVRWEQELNRKLISPLERRMQFAEHMIDGVLRGDQQSRYAAYAIARQWGWMSANNVLSLENQNPIGPQGDIYLVPLNMTPADRINEVIDAQIKAQEQPAVQPAAPKADDEVDARAMIAEIRVALTAAEERAEGHAVSASRAQAEAARMTESTAASDAAVAHAQAAVATSVQEVNTLQALLLEATERADRAQVERDAEAISRGAAEGETERMIARAITAEEQFYSASSVIATRDVELFDARAVLVAREQALRDAEARITERQDWIPGTTIATHAAEVEHLVMAADARERERDAAQSAVASAEQRAAEVELARAAAAEDLAELEAKTRQQMTAVIAAHRSLMADSMARMIRRETEKARRAMATPEKLRNWMDNFYPVHADICRAAILPAMRAHLAWQQSVVDPSTAAEAVVARHIEESIRQLRAVLESDPEDYPETLETTLRRWELERADVIADQILREEVSYVRETR